jgi:opacity protein-like surface antigen
MKRLAISALALCAMGALSAGHAADIYNPAGGSLKDGAGAFAQPATLNWSGVYVGGSVGYGNANHNLSLHDYFKDFCYDGDPVKLNPFEDSNHGAPATAWTLDNKLAYFEGRGATGTSCETLDIDGERTRFNAGDYATVSGDSRQIAHLDGVNSHGIVGDVRLGYDQQLGARLLVGLYGAYGFSGMETEASIAGLGTASIEKGDEWSIGARAGVLVNPRTLAYILAAYTETDYEFGISGGGNSATKDVTFSGVTVGGGVEFALTSNVFLGIEGTHTFYGEETLLDIYSPEVNRGIRLDDELSETKVMGTLKVKLNGAGLN